MTAWSFRSNGLRVAVVVLLVGLAAAVVYGQIQGRRGRTIAIDFTESIDSRVVHPMGGDADIIDKPATVDLRFPGGQSYHNDHAWQVWINRDSREHPELITSVSVNTGFETPDQIYDQARRFRDKWDIVIETGLDDWYEQRKIYGPGEWSIDMARGGREIAGTDRSGKRLVVEYELRGSNDVHPPYQLIEEFSWSRPRDEPDPGPGAQPGTTR